MRKYLPLVPLLFILSCENDQFQLDDQVTQINVIQVSDRSPSPDQFESDGKIINQMTAKKKMDQVRNALVKADVESTENVDLALPTYKVHFLKDNKIVQTLGYYPQDKDHEAAFLSLEKERIYRLDSSLSLLP